MITGADTQGNRLYTEVLSPATPHGAWVLRHSLGSNELKYTVVYTKEQIKGLAREIAIARFNKQLERKRKAVCTEVIGHREEESNA